MRTYHEHISPAKALLIQWRVLWAMAYMFAKTMTLAQYRDPRRAGEKAEMLQVWSRLALFTLIGEIAALETRGVPCSKEDDFSLSHLRAIIGALAMLCALAAKVKRECAGRAEFAAQTARHYHDDNSVNAFESIYEVRYLDSS